MATMDQRNTLEIEPVTKNYSIIPVRYTANAVLAQRKNQLVDFDFWYALPDLSSCPASYLSYMRRVLTH